jgi:hypothetical protein
MLYTKDDFIEEFFLRLEDKEFAAEWVWQLVSKADNIIQDYEARSSWPPPEASEVLGEMRERKLILEFLNKRMESADIPLCAAAYEDIITAIKNSEHYG